MQFMKSIIGFFNRCPEYMDWNYGRNVRNRLSLIVAMMIFSFLVIGDLFIFDVFNLLNPQTAITIELPTQVLNYTTGLLKIFSAMIFMICTVLSNTKCIYQNHYIFEKNISSTICFVLLAMIYIDAIVGSGSPPQSAILWTILFQTFFKTSVVHLMVIYAMGFLDFAIVRAFYMNTIKSYISSCAVLLITFLVLVMIQIFQYSLSKKWFRNIEKRKSIDMEKRMESKKNKIILKNIFPPEIVFLIRLNKGKVGDYHKSYEGSSIFFDIVSFTPMSEMLGAKKTILFVDYCFSKWDTLVKKHNLTKIRTIGDAMLVVNYGKDSSHSVGPSLLFSSDVLHSLDDINEKFFEDEGIDCAIRVGVSFGPIVICVIGKENISFDAFGGSIEMSMFLEETSEKNRIHCCDGIKSRCIDDRFTFTERENEWGKSYFCKKKKR